jgi:hypothetical protein
MLAQFIHFAGIIIGLGAVTVIDWMGFISRKSKEWTQVTIKAHHVTKPLIWVGTILLALSWIFLFSGTLFDIIKTILIFILIINGSFLSFYISPKLDGLYGKNTLLPKKLQTQIAISMIISFLSWWSLVLLSIK